MRQRPRANYVARYTLTWYDWDWHQIGESDELCTADEMIIKVESFNTISQMLARDYEVVIFDLVTPFHLSVEVHYVKR